MPIKLSFALSLLCLSLSACQTTPKTESASNGPAKQERSATANVASQEDPFAYIKANWTEQSISVLAQSKLPANIQRVHMLLLTLPKVVSKSPCPMAELLEVRATVADGKEVEAWTTRVCGKVEEYLATSIPNK
ncbi:hypothetical protein PFX98_07655 [Paucibacter sediminis]|uniref:Lipoprotein n=1 Tax=Paucibacter sediminis TaxID=3019553 RepID=A0AA95NFU9_9BURK|nr:hypothetical protein [Paucibacter sp. S2-9]WIT13479.1 hypothetical protein PFX98_07655 [Paucibacter sp. S2-9]